MTTRLACTCWHAQHCRDFGLFLAIALQACSQLWLMLDCVLVTKTVLCTAQVCAIDCRHNGTAAIHNAACIKSLGHLVRYPLQVFE